MIADAPQITYFFSYHPCNNNSLDFCWYAPLLSSLLLLIIKYYVRISMIPFFS